jgi:hypothetical protein
MLQWQEGFEVPEMPLAEDGGGVAFLFAEFGNGGFVGVDAVFCFGRECAADADAFGIAAG